MNAIVLSGVADSRWRRLPPGTPQIEANPPALPTSDTCALSSVPQAADSDPHALPCALTITLCPHAPSATGLLVLMRHGQSVWNVEKRFTGMADIPLSPLGRLQARAAGQLLKGHSCTFDAVYTSALERSQETARIALSELDPVAHAFANAALNERNWGELQGLHRDEAIVRFGKDVLEAWREDRNSAPPRGETIEQVSQRVVPFFEHDILPRLQRGENVLVVAHAETLETLDEHLMSDPGRVVRFRNAEPALYCFDGRSVRAFSSER